MTANRRVLSKKMCTYIKLERRAVIDVISAPPPPPDGSQNLGENIFVWLVLPLF
jgi:hypothetical protein